jgi:predicted Zn-dependent protease
LQSSTDFRTESPLKALFSIPVLLALVAMAGFYCTIVVPDRGLLNSIEPEKPGQNSGEVLKDARKLKPWKYMEKKNLVEAVKATQAMLAANPNDVAAAYCAAVVLHKANSPDAAFTQMKRALSLAPRNRELRLEYARMLADSQKYDEAITQYRLAIKQSPNATGPHMELAQIYMSLDKPADAALELEDLLKANPNDAAAHKMRGVALARSNKAQEGMDEYLAGMVSEHGAGQPEGVKVLLGMFGDMDRANHDLEQDAASRPEDPLPKLRLAQIALYADKPAEAKQYLLDARKLDKENPEIRRSLCVAYKRLGDNRNALIEFMQSVSLEKDQGKKNLKSVSAPAK